MRARRPAAPMLLQLDQAVKPPRAAKSAITWDRAAIFWRRSMFTVSSLYADEFMAFLLDLSPASFVLHLRC